MNKLKIFAIALMTFAAGIPASADNDNNGKEEQYEEIDNFDFLYDNEAYDEDYQFSQIDDVLSEAFSHLGARYRMGHSGPNSFDCSGFTSYVFKNMGIDLNRTSALTVHPRRGRRQGQAAHGRLGVLHRFELARPHRARGHRG